jgi:hypothetical protein
MLRTAARGGSSVRARICAAERENDFKIIPISENARIDQSFCLRCRVKNAPRSVDRKMPGRGILFENSLTESSV